MDITNYTFFKNLTQIPFIEEIWLYGSRARGDFSEQSDIDLAIIAPKISDKDWQKVLSIIREADTLLKVDCVHFDTISDNNFKNNIKQDKIVLFKRHMTQQELINQKILVLQDAVSRLHEATEIKPDPERLVIDATIQRFEFSFELFWKTLKYILKIQGIEAQFPKEVLKIAFQTKLISHESEYIAMLNDRNETSHTYDESIADRIYTNIIIYADRLKEDTSKVKQQFFKQ